MKPTLLLVALAAFFLGSAATLMLRPSEAPDDFGGNRITQLAIVVDDIETAAEVYAAMLGKEKPEIIITDEMDKAHTTYFGEPTEARAKLAFFPFENITLELIEPVGEPSTWADVLGAQGRGFHHFAFQVANMEESIAHLVQQGGEVAQRGDFTGGSYSYVNLDDQGIVIELLASE